jgi:phosphomannomutase/phosphoglucomutase
LAGNKRRKRAQKNSPTQKAQSGDGLWVNIGLVFGLASLGLLVTFALVWWQVIAQPQQAHADLERDKLLGQFSQLVNGRIAELRDQVNTIAQASATSQAMATYDSGSHRALLENLTALSPHIVRANLIQRGAAEVDLNAEVPISFAALDLIRRAETREFVGPEVSLNQRNLIYAAQPVTANGTVAGVLLVVFDSQFFLSPLSHFDSSLGTLEVIQKFEGSPSTTVMQWGSDAEKTPAATAQLFAPHWTLSLKAGTDALAGPDYSGALFLPAGVALLVILAAIFLGFSRYARMVREDAENLNEFATRVVRGRPVLLTGFNLGVLQDVAKALTPYAKEHEPEETAPVKDIEDDPASLLAGLDNEKVRGESFLDVSKAGSDDNFGIEVSEEVSPQDMGLELDPTIFRAYDIRGITTSNLTEDVVYWIGRAFGSEAIATGNQRACVGWDGRHSSEPLKHSLARGLSEAGMDVLSIGQVPTPVLYYATHALETGTGIMITGSHNPPEYNGLKMMIGGVTLAEDRIQALLQRINKNELSESEIPGEIEEVNVDDSYIDKILGDVALAQQPKVVVDCGNGVAGKLAPHLLTELGCEVIPLYCEVDGDFPNHHPDPAEPENLEDLITVVKAENADLGLAFDGDGDRLGVVTSSGEIIWPDKLIMLFAQDIVSRNPGADIIYDVKCSRHLNTLISDLGGRPIMWKTGHSHIKAKIKETGALLGGEFSGHICFAERWYGFDDALYSAARLLEIVCSDDRTVDELFEQFPVACSTPELKIHTTDTAKFEVMGRLEVEGKFEGGALTTIDGIRVDFSDGFGLIRPSNTSPVLSLRFEADTEEALERIQDVFQAQLSLVDETMNFRNPS